MRLRNRIVSAVRLLVVAAGATIFFTMVTSAQEASKPQGVPDDWTHHHVIYSNPGTFEDAVKNGKGDRWLRITSDKRYQLQQLKRSLLRQQLASAPDFSTRMGIVNAASNAGFKPNTWSWPKENLKRDWSMLMGTGTTTGAISYPATYTYSTTTGNCGSSSTPDFVVYNTGAAGSSTVPSIIAYDNLYSGCTAPYPTVYWQYDTGGTVTTSPILSLDGTQLAFVQADSSSDAQLVLLKWAAGSTLTTLTTEKTAADYTSRTAPCMYTMTFDKTEAKSASSATVPKDTYSSPFYDYNDDILYVGDDNGYVHQFVHVFNGTSSNAPSETDTSSGVSGDGFPQDAADAPVSSPVYDYASTYVFVGQAIGADPSYGMVHEIPTSGTISAVDNYQTGDYEPDSASDYVMYDGVLLDSSAEEMYVFVNNGSASSTSTASAAVWQLTVSGFTTTAPAEATVGQASETNPAFIGAFDNIYESAALPRAICMFADAPPAARIRPCGKSPSVTERWEHLWRSLH